MFLFDRFDALVDVAQIRSDGKVISPEMTLILALVIFDGYLLFPGIEERRLAVIAAIDRENVRYLKSLSLNNSLKCIAF